MKFIVINLLIIIIAFTSGNISQKYAKVVDAILNEEFDTKEGNYDFYATKISGKILTKRRAKNKKSKDSIKVDQKTEESLKLSKLTMQTPDATCSCTEKEPLKDMVLELIGDRYFFKSNESMASGTSAEVYHGYSVDLKFCVAIKYVYLKDEPEQYKLLLRKETKILEIFSARNKASRIVRLYNYIEKGDTITLVLELGKISAFDAIMAEDEKNTKFLIFNMALEKSKIANIFKEIVLATKEMHEEAMHLDMKLENMMYFPVLSSDGTPEKDEYGNDKLILKLIDFGTAELIDPKKHGVNWTPMEKKIMSNTQIVKEAGSVIREVSDGTLEYNAPEQLQKVTNYFCDHDLKVRAKEGYKVSTKTDIWALGSILYRLIFGHPPFGEASIGDIEARITDVNAYKHVDYIHSPRYWRFNPEKFKELINIIKACLQHDSKLRPTAKGIYNYLEGKCNIQMPLDLEPVPLSRENVMKKDLNECETY